MHQKLQCRSIAKLGNEEWWKHSWEWCEQIQIQRHALIRRPPLKRHTYFNNSEATLLMEKMPKCSGDAFSLSVRA